MNGKGMGCLILISIPIGIIMMMLLIFGGDPGGTGTDVEEELDVLGGLTEEGEQVARSDIYADVEEGGLRPLGQTLQVAADAFGVHWVFLLSILENQTSSEADNQECVDRWIGTMNLKRQYFVGEQFIEENPEARTDLSHCGDVDDDAFENEMKLEDEQDTSTDNRDQLVSCLEKEQEEKKEYFCQAYGRDMDQDGEIASGPDRLNKRNPDKSIDAIYTASALISDYSRKFGGMSQALELIYGEDPVFLRSIKMDVSTWLKDPSVYNIYHWPVDPNVNANKKVTEIFDLSKQQEGLKIAARNGQEVRAPLTSNVHEVNDNQGCVELRAGMVVEICGLVEIEVEEGERLHLADPELKSLGKVGEDPLFIRVGMNQPQQQEEEGTDENERIEWVDPEIYLAVPIDVEYEIEETEEDDDEEEEDENSSTSEE